VSTHLRGESEIWLAFFITHYLSENYLTEYSDWSILIGVYPYNSYTYSDFTIDILHTSGIIHSIAKEILGNE
jgi:hypothetical protein